MRWGWIVRTGRPGYRCNAEPSGKTVSGLTGKLILKGVLRHETHVLGEGGEEHDRHEKASDIRRPVLRTHTHGYSPGV